MKFLLGFILCLPLTLRAQHVILTSADADCLYQEINHSLLSNDPKFALRTFKKLVDIYAESNRKEELPEKYFGMALGLALNGFYKESIAYHKKAIRLHHKYRKGEPLEISINLGLTYYLAGKEKKAKRILGNSI
jgi:tetratricopeptide (TPR) repeat protein